MSMNQILIYIIDLYFTNNVYFFLKKKSFFFLPSNGKNVTSILHDDRNFAGGGQKTCPLFSTIALL